MNDIELDAAVVEAFRKSQERPKRPTKKELARRTELAPDAPAPRLAAEIAIHGEPLTTAALEAWNARLGGAPIIDVAHQLGVSIELAKKLINEVHAAIYEDLKANIDLNRQLDLGRIDRIIKGHLSAAERGDEKSANVVLRAVAQRAKLTGVEAPEAPTRGAAPHNLMIWIQNQLPAINRIVDNLPLE